VGVGDDAAVLVPTPGRRLVVTTDVVVEGRHFDAALSGPEDWGWKAVTVNLSDLAAMGAEPRWLVVALTVPPAAATATLERVYAGMGEACREYGVALVGGDTSGGPALSLAVTAIGEAGRVVTRSGARPGDRLVVTGPLGAAAAGLGLLRLATGDGRPVRDAGRADPPPAPPSPPVPPSSVPQPSSVPPSQPSVPQPAASPSPPVPWSQPAGPRGPGAREAARELLARHPHLAAAHRRPRPQLAMGLRLAAGGATAMLDVSDGLAGDVLHLADASGTGVEVHDAAVPLATGVAEAAALLGRDPVELALGGGEDFALAAALPRTADVGGVVDCGTFTARADRRVRITPAGAALPLAGLAYDHFRS
jgi:thiamine monophosphate kinase